jgi:hypothetical protein
LTLDGRNSVKPQTVPVSPAKTSDNLNHQLKMDLTKKADSQQSGGVQKGSMVAGLSLGCLVDGAQPSHSCGRRPVGSKEEPHQRCPAPPSDRPSHKLALPPVANKSLATFSFSSQSPPSSLFLQLQFRHSCSPPPIVARRLCLFFWSLSTTIMNPVFAAPADPGAPTGMITIPVEQFVRTRDGVSLVISCLLHHDLLALL